MKVLKGLYTDSSELDNPPGTYRYAKNIVDSNTIGAKENEDGFLDIGQLTPYTCIGVIPIEKSFVLFSTNNTDSEIGILDLENGSLNYVAVYNNAALNFDTTKPIKGEFRKDVNGDRIITWIDDINVPRILNIDDLSGVNDVTDLELFQDISNPSISSSSIGESGGSLKTGAYILITRYKNYDGSQTDWFVHDRVYYINNHSKLQSFPENDGGEGGEVGSKVINLTLDSLDTRYDTLVIGYIYSNNNIVTASQIREITNSGTLTIAITGSESPTDITLDEILTNTVNYNNAKAITTLNGRLYLANLTADTIPDLQAVANAVLINYTQTPITVVTNTGAYKDDFPPTLIPGEVYAFYLGVELNRGGWLYYHIPGRAAVAGDLNNRSINGVNGLSYQVEDTCDKGGAATNMSYWENTNETYPDDPVWSGYTNVRHHKMPSLGYLVTTYYGGDSTIGITTLPRLGINISNVNIPVEIQAKIKRWKIFYAKKTTENSLFCGDDLSQFNFRSTDVNPNLFWSTGGNWYTNSQGSGWYSFNQAVTDRLRGHSLSLTQDSSITSVDYLEVPYQLRRVGLNLQYNGFRATGGKLTITGSSRGSVQAAVIDYTVQTYTSRIATTLASNKVKIDGF